MTKYMALQIASDMAVRRRVPVLFVSIDGMTAIEIMSKLLAMESAVSLEKLDNGALAPSDFSSIIEACAKLYEAPLYICDKTHDLPSQIRQSVANQGIQVVFVDSVIAGIVDAVAAEYALGIIEYASKEG